MDQDDDDKTPRKKAQKEERKEEGIARNLLERRKSDTPLKDKKEELVKIKLDRDWYKSECENKERRIQEYHKTLAQYETQLEEFDEAQLDKDIEIQRLKEEVDYLKKEQIKKTPSIESVKLKDSEVAGTKKAVGGKLSEKVVEVEDLKELLQEKEQKIINLKEETSKTSRLAQEERKQTINQLRKQVDELLKKTNTKDKQIKELVEKLQVKEGENAVYKQDFETERSDRQRIHAQYEELRLKFKERSQHEADQKVIANLGEVIKDQEEEIQVLTAQVNAFSRECEKQKGFVEKHKTEIQELNEKLNNGQKSKQQLENQLTILREQVDSLTASRESLLTAYNQEQAMVTSLDQQLQRMREESAMIKEESIRMKSANKVLMEKVRAHKESANSPPMHPSTNKPIAVRHNSSDSKADSFPEDTPHMSKEEISRLFKWQDQQEDSGRVTVTQTPQQVEDLLVKERRRQELAQKAEQALLEVDQVRKQPPCKTMLPHTSSKQEPVNQRQPKKKIKQQQAAADDSDTDIEENPLLENIDVQIHEMAEEVRRMSRRPDTQEVLFDDEDRPYDPNLVCRKCGKRYREGEIQKLKRHLSTNCDNDDCDGNIRKNQATKEIHDMAEEIRKMSRRPDTQQVLFDDEDSPLPYDPNLVCPKCGRQYRVGEIQKLKRHMVEFCTGKR